MKLKQQPWSEKHRPQNFEDLKGQEQAVQQIKNFIGNFYLGQLTKTRKKAMILHGPPGTGKTTIAHIIARETNSELFELNASDLRNKSKLDEVLRPVVQQKSLTKSKKVVLVDEVDGVNTDDRGGIPELISLIALSSYPIILTANDIWDRKFNPLRQKCELIQLKEIDYHTITDILINILRKENLFVNQNILKSISIRAKGDIRAAINDLQSIARLQDPSMITFDEREKKSDIFQALKLIFKSKPCEETLRIFDNLNMPIDEIILWVEENIPQEYRDFELERAIDNLSRTDVFKGRIYKQQYWRFLVYENIFLSYGISAAKNPDKKLGGFTSYKKPTRILKIWLNNQRTEKKKSISEKYAKFCHLSIKRAMNEFSLIKPILKISENQKALKLSEEEIDYIMK